MVPDTIGAGSVTIGTPPPPPRGPLAQAATSNSKAATHTPLITLVGRFPDIGLPLRPFRMAKDISALVNAPFGAMRPVRSMDTDRWPSGLRQRS